MVEEPHDSAVAQQEPNDLPGGSENELVQPSMVVGKIPPGEGLWGALEAITTCDSVRNGVLVVFSHEVSGRLGVFCNRYITGAVVDSTNVEGLKALKKLLAVSSGMFCFRSCFADETAELGQSISLDIVEVLHVRAEDKGTAPPSEAVQQLTGSATKGTLADSYLNDVADMPLESAFVVTTSGDSLTESVPTFLESSLFHQPPEDGEIPPPSQAPAESEYLDWFEKQEKTEGPNLNLRKILLPVFEQSSPDSSTRNQMDRDLTLYANIIRQEEDKVRRDIEKTLEKAQADVSVQQTLDDMQLLAGLLHSQEEMIQKRWQGLDDIPTPKAGSPTHFDSTGGVRSGGPVRSSKEFLSGCADLVNQTTKATDPREFLKKSTSEDDSISHFSILNHPRFLALGAAAVFGVLILAISYQLNSSAVGTYLKEAKEHLHAQRWSDALVSFNAALNQDPTNGRAYFYRGICYEELGDEKKAQKDFESAGNLGVRKSDIATAVATIHINNEDWQKAVDVCDDALKGNDRCLALYRIRTTADLHLGAFKDAEQDCNKALELCKDDPKEHARILADRGFARYQTGDLTGGSSDFDAALKNNPDRALYQLKADALRKAKKYPDAVASYTEALRLDPRNYDSYVGRGISEVQLHQTQAALKDFGRALSINANGVEALIQRGSLELSNGLYRQALDDLQTAWDLNPTVDETRQKLLIAYGKARQDIPKALLSGNTATANSHMPSDPNQLLSDGYKLLTQGDADTAIDYLMAAVKKAPANADARRYLAYALAQSHDFSSAAAQFKALSSLQGLTDRDVLAYADALEQEQDDRDAVTVLNAAIRSGRAGSAVYQKLAEIYYGAGQRSAGDAIAQQGINNPNTTDADRHQLQDVMRNSATLMQSRQKQPAVKIAAPG